MLISVCAPAVRHRYAFITLIDALGDGLDGTPALSRWITRCLACARHTSSGFISTQTFDQLTHTYSGPSASSVAASVPVCCAVVCRLLLRPGGGCVPTWPSFNPFAAAWTTLLFGSFDGRPLNTGILHVAELLLLELLLLPLPT